MHSSPSSATARGTPSRRGRSAAASPAPSAPESSTRGEGKFFSSLDIPVEGAIPLGPDGAPNLREQARKSKTDALAALSSRGDLDTLSTKYLDGAPQGARQPLSNTPLRPMGIQNCPEYYPTIDEFKDPMGYIKAISDEAQNYGICKIVPPEGWEMPFVTDTELNFLEQLYRYHKQQGNPRVAVPTINHKPLDLWLLRKEVKRLGGYDEVTKQKKWPDMGRLLGYGGIPVILPYEHFCERHVTMSPKLKSIRTRLPSPPMNGILTFLQQTCEVCHKKNRGEEMLLCDGCDCGFHMFCLDPPLSVIPREQWFCYTCLAGTGGDYGFDEGEEHSLSSFQARDKEFRRFWFERHPPAGREEEVPKEMQSKVGDVVISEYDLEEEFWRLVETQQETVEVEYGADVHSTTHGSAMPTMETHPLDQYARDPWNLNNIAIVPDSLLRFIKSDISGMTYLLNPDLLFQLVTLMNPKRVSEAGVRRAGEAYHAGFNHGMNFNEAVNFAIRTASNVIVNIGNLPVFSHDELLITITQQSFSVKTSVWLSDSLQEMVNREMEDRGAARSLKMKELLVPEDRPEDQYQCTVCKAFCYLSQVTCACTTKVRKVHEKASSPLQWKTKFEKLLIESARPSLRSLRAILAEGDRLGVQYSDLSSLRKCDELEPVQRGLDELYLLLENVETLGFDSPEIAGLRSLGAQAEDAKAKTAKLLGVPVEEQDDAYLQECKMVLLNSESINVHLEEVQQLVGIVDRDKLLKELEKLQAGGHSTLEDVKAYLSRAKTCGLADSHPQMQVLQARLQEGYEWEQEAHRLLQKPIKTIEEMQAFLDKESTVPVDPDLLDSIATTHAKAMDFDRQADAWLSCNPGAPRPRVSEVMRLCQRAEKEFDLKSIREIKRTADIAIEMEDFFTMFDEWRTYGINHLRMFQLPGFTKFEQQLDAHDAWLKELPCEVILQETTPQQCICQKPVRGPENPNDPPSDAVQFHGACARKGGSCPFCDHHHWNGSIRKTRNWHSFYFPAILMKAPDLSKNYSRAWKDLQVIIHRLDRLCNVIGTFLMFASQPVNQKQELIPQTRHFMRKLYKLEFAVSPSPDISFGLDLSGLHRVLAHMPHAPSTTHQRPRRRYCHFIFGQDVDSDWADGTRCICRGRTSYLLAYSTVKCCQCRRVYHSGCVFYNQDPSSFECPLCCLRKGKTYNYCDVRVKPNMTSEDARNPDKFVDTKTMTITGSDRLIFSMMPDPTRPTIFVELVKFKISDTDPSAIDLTGSHGHTNGSSYVGAPPPPPWSNGGSNGTSSASSASAPPRPAPPISAASSGRLEARNPYPAAYQPPPPRSQAVEYQHYDPRNPTKKRKVDDLQKFGGDVALFGAHGDHAGNRRWTERSKAAHAPSHHSPIAASPSSAAPSRHYSCRR
ncbi:PLU-1-like protein-domain-containing protein [Flagelloscypha sp. PMI_526]|nr:PLU-1-like protein-domain-containing protein [Flagelloscypha sp. PMI_526]